MFILVSFMSCGYEWSVINVEWGLWTDQSSWSRAVARPVERAAVCMLFLQSAVNPLVYGVMNRNFREVFKNLFRFGTSRRWTAAHLLVRLSELAHSSSLKKKFIIVLQNVYLTYKFCWSNDTWACNTFCMPMTQYYVSWAGRQIRVTRSTPVLHTFFPHRFVYINSRGFLMASVYLAMSILWR